MSNYVWGDSETQFFHELSPDIVLEAVESLGLITTGRCLTLNSMENRVYEIEIEKNEISSESDKFVVAKFYRPGRWSENQIRDEHEFMFDLLEEEIPVIAPLKFNDESLFKLPEQELWFTLFPKKGGRMATEMSLEQLEVLGRLLARLHNIGASKKAKHRLELSPETFGLQNLKFLIDKKLIPAHLENRYSQAVEKICQVSSPLFKGIETHRVHGDCHWGNILYRDENLFLIDFDDMATAPAVQDIWLAVPGDDRYALQDRAILLEAYEEMRTFDYNSLKLIEPLRALRFIHFSAWIAKRWDDQAFKMAFAHFGTENYWQTQIADLENQLIKIQE